MLYREIIAVCSGTTVTNQTKTNKQTNKSIQQSPSEADSFSASQAMNPAVRYSHNVSPSLVSILSMMNPVYPLQTDYIKCLAILIFFLA